MNKNIKTEIVLAIIFGLSLLIGGVLWLGSQDGRVENQPTAITPPVNSSTLTPALEANQKNYDHWKTYQNKQNGFEFKYPSKLALEINNRGPIAVELRHSIPYENTGDCDMMEPQSLSKTLDDLKITFEIRNEQVELSFDDGDFSAGILKGKHVYEGVEGCGPDAYYFPFKENKTLVVKLWIPQLLSGNVNAEFSKEILSVPGVITGDDSREIFNQILSTFKFLQ